VWVRSSSSLMTLASPAAQEQNKQTSWLEMACSKDYRD
jgi:hypothetical protein